MSWGEGDAGSTSGQTLCACETICCLLTIVLISRHFQSYPAIFQPNTVSLSSSTSQGREWITRRMKKNLAERPWVVRPKTGYAIRLNIVTDRSIPARWARRRLPAQDWLSGGAAGRVLVVRQYSRARLSAWFLEGGVWQVPGAMRACLEIPFPAQRLSSRRLQMVFSTFTRAWYLLFASTSVQGAADVLVRSTISHTAEAYSSHFSRLRQSSSVIL